MDHRAVSVHGVPDDLPLGPVSLPLHLALEGLRHADQVEGFTLAECAFHGVVAYGIQRSSVDGIKINRGSPPTIIDTPRCPPPKEGGS